MQNREVYEYSVIRLMPKVDREEFINIGIILFSKRFNYLDIRLNIDENRLSIFDKELDVKEIKRYLNSWVEICKGLPNGGKIGELDKASRFRWLVSAKSTIIQCSRTHPGITNDPTKALENTFKRMVL